MDKPPETETIAASFTFAKLAANGIVAIMGGIVHELVHGKGYSFIRFFAGSAVGAFTGCMAYTVCKHFGIGEWLTVTVVGMAGFTGAPLLDVGSRVIRKIVERNIPS